MILDILRLDGKKIYKKSRNFATRNYTRIRRWSAHIWEELKHIGHGFKTFKKDIQESVTDTKDLHYQKYTKPTYTHTVKLQKITKDVVKFIPFSVFILIPGLELLLPAWLMIFPNAIPSQFQSPASRQKQITKLIANRNTAAEKLLYKYPKYLKKLSKTKILPEDEREQAKEILKIIEKEGVTYTQLLQYKHIFTKYADFKHFRVKTLYEMAHFMGLNPITGLNTINNVLSIFRLKIKIDNIYVSWLTKIILTRELRLFFRKIRREDAYLSTEQISNFPENHLDSILIERGIEIANRSKESKLKDYKMYQAISNLNNVPDSLLIFCRLNEFANDLYRINMFEQEMDLIKRLGSKKGYNARKRRLEEYLGMAQVKDSLGELFNSRVLVQANPKFIDGQNDEGKIDPQEIIKADMMTTKKEYELEDFKRYSNALDEYKIRHNSIIKEVDSIYNELDFLLEELEQNVILGYLDRKELDEIPKIQHLNLNIERIKQKVVEDPNEDATAKKFKSLIELSKSLSNERNIKSGM